MGRINFRTQFQGKARNFTRTGTGYSKPRAPQGLQVNALDTISNPTGQRAATQFVSLLTGKSEKQVGKELTRLAKKTAVSNPTAKLGVQAATAKTSVVEDAKDQLANIHDIKEELKSNARNFDISSQQRENNKAEISKRFKSAIDDFNSFHSENERVLTDHNIDRFTNADGSDVTASTVEQFADAATSASGMSTLDSSYDVEQPGNQMVGNAEVQHGVATATQGIMAFLATRPEASIGVSMAAAGNSSGLLAEMINSSQVIADALGAQPNAYTFITEKLHNMDLSQSEIAKIRHKLDIFAPSAGGISSTTLQA